MTTDVFDRLFVKFTEFDEKKHPRDAAGRFDFKPTAAWEAKPDIDGLTDETWKEWLGADGSLKKMRPVAQSFKDWLYSDEGSMRTMEVRHRARIHEKIGTMPVPKGLEHMGHKFLGFPAAAANPSPEKIPDAMWNDWLSASAVVDYKTLEQLEEMNEDLARHAFHSDKGQELTLVMRRYGRRLDLIREAEVATFAPKGIAQDEWDRLVDLKSRSEDMIIEEDARKAHRQMLQDGALNNLRKESAYSRDQLDKAAAYRTLERHGGVDGTIEHLAQQEIDYRVSGWWEDASGDEINKRRRRKNSTWNHVNRIMGYKGNKGDRAIGMNGEIQVREHKLQLDQFDSMSEVHRALFATRAIKGTAPLDRLRDNDMRNLWRLKILVAKQRAVLAVAGLTDRSEVERLIEENTAAGNVFAMVPLLQHRVRELELDETFARGHVTRAKQIANDASLRQQYEDVKPRLHEISGQISGVVHQDGMSGLELGKTFAAYSKEKLPGEEVLVRRHLDVYVERVLVQGKEAPGTVMDSLFTPVSVDEMDDVEHYHDAMVKDNESVESRKRYQQAYDNVLKTITESNVERFWNHQMEEGNVGDWAVSLGVLKAGPIDDADIEPFSPDAGSKRRYKRTQELANHLQKTRGADLAKERGVDQDILEFVTESLWDDWKVSSTSPYGKALQLAAVDELGAVGKPEYDRDREAIIQKIGEPFYEAVKVHSRATWESSQYILDRAGQDNVVLWRGLKVDHTTLPEPTLVEPGHGETPSNGTTYGRLDDLKLLRNGASSATRDPGIANSWDGVGKQPDNASRVVLRIDAGREDILSLPVFGQNVHREQEVIVTGNRWNRWDAWLYEAPTSRTGGWKDQPEKPPVTEERIDRELEELQVTMTKYISNGEGWEPVYLDMEPDGEPHWLSVPRTDDDGVFTKAAGGFDELKHPRDKDGQFDEKPGGGASKESTSPGKDKLPQRKDRVRGFDAVKDRVSGALLGTKGDKERLAAAGQKGAETGLASPEKREQYSAVLRDALNQLSPGMLETASNNIKSVEMYANTGSLTSEFHRINRSTPDGSTALGWYVAGKGRMGLDGGGDQRGTYIHELAHAADTLQNGTKFSSSSAWKMAYEQEIDVEGAPLSKYARTNSEEGFAEFVRYVAENSDDARNSFPRATRAVEIVYGRL